ncbi:hypothetical protein P7K49_020607 [Saguinus oedipus]|uniref:Uncharacterized protein n=1 Tax=Saguinus oedipus TaxID=9490 RepID=A0ABQ9V1G5_SAGOE|nr:hypothetical protein P7K49_020607 [Saguinus oedipus]
MELPETLTMEPALLSAPSSEPLALVTLSVADSSATVLVTLSMADSSATVLVTLSVADSSATVLVTLSVADSSATVLRHPCSPSSKDQQASWFPESKGWSSDRYHISWEFLSFFPGLQTGRVTVRSLAMHLRVEAAWQSPEWAVCVPLLIFAVTFASA